MVNLKLFKSKQRRDPHQVVKECQGLMKQLETNTQDHKKATEMTKSLDTLKGMLQTQRVDPILADELCLLLKRLVPHLRMLELDARKDVVQVTQTLLKPANASAIVIEYLAEDQDLLLAMLQGYQDPDVALLYGQLMRSCIKHQDLAAVYLKHLDRLFEAIQIGQPFDILSDLLAAFRELLTIHKEKVADYLETNYVEFFEQYRALLLTEDYLIKRQSIKLLSEILLERSHFGIMERFIADEENLKITMNLLRDKRKNVQFEAFHVFKIFVANPNKSEHVLDILKKNQSKLITFLTTFHDDRKDEQFLEEKEFLIKQIEDL